MDKIAQQLKFLEQNNEILLLRVNNLELQVKLLEISFQQLEIEKRKLENENKVLIDSLVNPN